MSEPLQDVGSYEDYLASVRQQEAQDRDRFIGRPAPPPAAVIPEAWAWDDFVRVPSLPMLQDGDSIDFTFVVTIQQE